VQLLIQVQSSALTPFLRLPGLEHGGDISHPYCLLMVERIKSPSVLKSLLIYSEMSELVDTSIPRLCFRLLRFHTEGGDTLEQVAQGGCGCPIPGGIQGHSRLAVALGSLVWWLATTRGVETR